MKPAECAIKYDLTQLVSSYTTQQENNTSKELLCVVLFSCALIV